MISYCIVLSAAVVDMIQDCIKEKTIEFILSSRLKSERVDRE